MIDLCTEPTPVVEDTNAVTESASTAVVDTAARFLQEAVKAVSEAVDKEIPNDKQIGEGVEAENSDPACQIDEECTTCSLNWLVINIALQSLFILALL